MKKGFTLIELLVVVLIIGILSAVALPQYNLAVQKTRTMRLLPLMKAVDTAQQVYRMETGEYTDQWEDLSIEMPGAVSVGEKTGTLYYKDFHCYLNGNQSIKCGGVSKEWHPVLEKYFDKNYFICWGDENSQAEKICKSISGKSSPSSSSSAGLAYDFN